MRVTTQKEYLSYRKLLSPESVSGMSHPAKGMALMEEKVVPEEEALLKIAEKLLKSKKPVIFTPGRIILWTWEEGAPEKAKALRDLARAIGAEILPVFDIRPAYPTTVPGARTAVEINPYHPDLIIGHNKYDVAVFIGIGCPYADVALKIIRKGTVCYTIALCGALGHVDAAVSVRDTGLEKLKKLTKIINKLKQKMSAPSPSEKARNLYGEETWQR